MTNRILKGAQDVHHMQLFPDPVSIDFDPLDLALPEPKRISKHLCQYLLAQPVLTDDWQLFFGHFRFGGNLDVPSDLFPRAGHEWFHRARKIFYNHPYDRLITFEWQHSTPNTGHIITHGFAGLLSEIAQSKAFHRRDAEKMEFLEACEECCRGIIAWAHKCAEGCLAKAEELEQGPALTNADETKVSNELRARELREAAEVLYHVPEHPARTFREGVQTIWMTYQFLTDSIGTIDRYLYPLYKQDMENGTLTRDQAKEYLQSLFLMLQAHTDYLSGNHNRGGECHFAIGGYLPTGEDGFNDLSRLIVEALMEMPMNIPEISLRWTKKTPHEVLHFMMDCERHDPYKRIAFVNDEPHIKCYMNKLGFSYEDACSYTMVGCNEPAFPGTVWYGGSTVNIIRSLEDCLHDGKEAVLACTTFDAFYALYEKYMERDLDEIIQISNQFNAIRAKDCNVISSLLIDGCIQNATPANRSGCRLKLGGFEPMGLTCLIDSLTVIKQFVYDEKLVTMEHLLEVLDSNWELDPDLRTIILKKAKFFGNHEAISDEMAVRVTNSLNRLTENKRLAGGEQILIGTLAGYNPHYAFFGDLMKATPDGRYDHEAFAVGSGQSFGRDRSGLLALLASVAQMQPSGILCGPFVLNVSLDEMLIRQDDYFEKTVDMIEEYFREDGMHIQLNYVSREELLEAQKTPEKYKNCKVRISGYSDYFINLRSEIQENVIARTIQRG